MPRIRCPPNSRRCSTRARRPAATWALERILDYMGPRRSTQRQHGLPGARRARRQTRPRRLDLGSLRLVRRNQDAELPERRLRLGRTLRRIITAPNYGANFSRQDPSDGILGYEITCTTGLPVFTSFTPSQDCIDAIEARMKNITNFSQTIFEANFQGGLFDLPAGEVRAAAGLGYRKNAVTFDPDVLNDQRVRSSTGRSACSRPTTPTARST